MTEIIKFNNVSKSYPIYDKPIDVVKEFFNKKCLHKTFWALNDINFSIKEGERVGFVGANGAGKSTLLKLVTQNLMPTHGEVQVNGEISAMLSLTSFLNPEETGFDNIKMNLAYLGVSQDRIPQLTEEIIEFTELGDFIYAPVKTYSSGMNAKLAFGITTSIEPQILVIDEVLGVGDGYFANKSYKRITELCARGRALLFVSHSTAAVKMMCDRVIWLDKGMIRMDGRAADVLAAYEQDFRDQVVLDLESQKSGGVKKKVAQKEAANIESHWQLRVTPTNKKGLKKQYYVSGLSVDIDGSSYQADLLHNEGAVIQLDTFNSQWGRHYDLFESSTRSLLSQTGKAEGGQVLISKGLAENQSGALKLKVALNYIADKHASPLQLELFNEEKICWEPLETISSVKKETLNNSYANYEAHLSGELRFLEDSIIKKTKQSLEDSLREGAEFIDVWLESSGQRSKLVAERKPFKVVAKYMVHSELPLHDVCLRIIRSDGTYFFWQSSAETVGNQPASPGIYQAVFDFSPNLFPAGDYEISGSIANGFDIEKNYPYSKMYDSRALLATFKVDREEECLERGAINTRVGASIERLEGATEDSRVCEEEMM